MRLSSKLAIRFIFLIATTYLVGCASLKPIEGAEETRILLLSKTNDRFDIVHTEYHIIPRFMKKTIITGQPSWTLSDLFHNYVMSKQKDSKYAFISGINESIPSSFDKREKELQRLAKKYDAHYIFILRTYPWMDEYGHILLNTEYGYHHKFDLSILFDLEPVAHPSLNADIDLLVSSKLDTSPFSFDSFGKFKQCSIGFVYRDHIDPISLPKSLAESFDLSLVASDELERMYKAVRTDFERRILIAMRDCGLIPSPPKTKTHKRNRRD